MTVTATEFKINLGKYLTASANEDIFITKNGKTIARLSNPNSNPVDAIDGLLCEQISNEYGSKELRLERLSKYEVDD